MKITTTMSFDNTKLKDKDLLDWGINSLAETIKELGQKDTEEIEDWIRFNFSVLTGLDK